MLRFVRTMRCVLVILSACAVLTTRGDRFFDTGETIIDEAMLGKYVEEIRGLRKQGKTWKEVEQIMGIWWPEDDDRSLPERFEPRGRMAEAAKSKQQVKEMVSLLYKRLAEDQEKLEKYPDAAKETKYTIPIIKYVANIDKELKLKLDDE